MRLVIGSPLPGADDFLPTASEVVRVMSGTPGRTNKPLEQAESQRLSGSPGCPADPLETPTRLGTEMFPILIANAVKDGHITEDEATERYALHKAVARA